MIHHPDQLVAWLREAASKQDRVLANALGFGQITVCMEAPGWRVCVTSRRGIEYRVIVVADSVGRPERYYRDATVSKSDPS